MRDQRKHRMERGWVIKKEERREDYSQRRKEEEWCVFISRLWLFHILFHLKCFLSLLCPTSLPTYSCLSLSFCPHYLSHLFFLSTCHLCSSPFFLLSLLSFILCALLSIRPFHLCPYHSHSLVLSSAPVVPFFSFLHLGLTLSLSAAVIASPVEPGDTNE